METARTQKLTIASVSHDQWKGLFAITWAFVSRFLITALIEPFFPPEGRRHGVSVSLNGIIMSTTAVVTLLTSPGIGMMVAFIGPRKTITIGTGINVASMITFGCLQFVEPLTAFAIGSFILIGIHAFGSACVSISACTLGAKLFPRNISLVVGAAELCVAIGETISLLTSGVIHDAGGFYLPFLVFSLIHLLSIPICYILLPRDDIKANRSGPEADRDSEEVSIRPWHLLKIPRVVIIAMLIPLNGACWAFQGANLEAHLLPLNLTTTQVNLMFLLTSGTYGVVCPIVGWVADRLNHKWPPVAVGLIGAGLSMTFLGPLPIFGLLSTVAQNVIVLILVTILLAVCTVPAFQAIVWYTIDAGYKNDVATFAVAMSLISTTDPIGQFVGSFGGGFLVENLGFPVASAIVGGVMALAGLIIFSYFACVERIVQSDRRGEGNHRSISVHDFKTAGLMAVRDNSEEAQQFSAL